jgi:hypothetical protein
MIFFCPIPVNPRIFPLLLFRHLQFHYFIAYFLIEIKTQPTNAFYTFSAFYYLPPLVM